VTPEIKHCYKKAGIHSYPEDEPTPSAQTDTENNIGVISISDSSDMETNGEDGRPASTGLEEYLELQIDDDRKDFLIGDEFDGWENESERTLFKTPSFWTLVKYAMIYY